MQKILPPVMLFALLSGFYGQSMANVANSIESATVQHEISPSSLPVVVTGGELKTFIGKPASGIRLLAFNGDGFISIPFQIDARDKDGKYVIPGKKESSKDRNFDENDELVFMSHDAAKKRSPSADKIAADLVMEIELSDPASNERRWVYVVIDNEHYKLNTTEYVNYDSNDDAVNADHYRIGFSGQQPFIVDALSRRKSGTDDWSKNLIDTMKLHHKGTMLGLIDFERNHADYSSKLVAVKAGPIRVLRRTSNKVRILWWLKSPEVLIDYIAHQNGFQMDIIIDIPFKIGLVFSEVESIASVDWNNDESLPPLEIEHSEVAQAMQVDGRMSADETRLKDFQDTDVVLVNDYGQMFIQMSITEGSPILQSIHYVDDVAAVDPPENIPGQFGNLGFRTYKWEELDTAISHMFFNAHLRPAM